MTYNRILLSAATTAVLFIVTTMAWADDLLITGVISGTQSYDASEGIIFDDAVLSPTADVTAVSTFEVVLKPGTTVKSGGRLLIRLKDNDGLPNRWEMTKCNTLAHGTADDPDDDNLTMAVEYQIHTHPCDADTDGDDMPDGWEVLYGFDPLVPDGTDDADEDGLSNKEEYQFGTDPREEDTDGDGMPDEWEARNDLDPLRDDTLEDYDGDGVINGVEYEFGTTPNDPNSNPAVFQFDYDENGNLINMQ